MSLYISMQCVVCSKTRIVASVGSLLLFMEPHMMIRRLNS
jgi:hypothetical protein